MFTHRSAFMDDCVQLVLHHACHLRIQGYCRKLHASLATGEDVTVCNIEEEPIVVCSGIIGTNETMLLSYEIQPHEMAVVVRTAELDKANAAAKDFELCLQDTVGDDGGEYDDERSEDGEILGGGQVRFPCLGWGRRRRLSYTIALSRCMSARIDVDAVVVPTSWWIDDCEGTYWVVQMTYAGEVPERVNANRRLEGRQVVGWKADATSDRPQVRSAGDLSTHAES